MSSRKLLSDDEGESPLRSGLDVPEVDLARKEWVGTFGTLDTIIKTQRRIKGVIVSLDPDNMRIASEYGEFPFSRSAIKENKRFPDRLPRIRDRCEFKVSEANPPRATSIRIAIPKHELVVGASVGVGESQRPTSVVGGNSSVNISVGGSTFGGSPGNSGSPIASSAYTESNSPGFSEPRSGLEDLCAGLSKMSATSILNI